MKVKTKQIQQLRFENEKFQEKIDDLETDNWALKRALMLETDGVKTLDSGLKLRATVRIDKIKIQLNNLKPAVGLELDPQAEQDLLDSLKSMMQQKDINFTKE